MGNKRRYRLHCSLCTGLKTAEGRAAIAAAKTKHERNKNWRSKQTREGYYRGEFKRFMKEATEAGLLMNN